MADSQSIHNKPTDNNFKAQFPCLLHHNNRIFMKDFFVLAGEDGFVKVWSRNGLLRSTIVQSDVPCFSAVWSPDSSAILHTKGNSLVIKQLNSSNKITKVRIPCWGLPSSAFSSLSSFACRISRLKATFTVLTSLAIDPPLFGSIICNSRYTYVFFLSVESSRGSYFMCSMEC